MHPRVAARNRRNGGSRRGRAPPFPALRGTPAGGFKQSGTADIPSLQRLLQRFFVGRMKALSAASRTWPGMGPEHVTGGGEDACPLGGSEKSGKGFVKPFVPIY